MKLFNLQFKASHITYMQKFNNFLYLADTWNHKKYNTKRHITYNKELRTIYINFTIALLQDKLNIDKNKFNNYNSIIEFLEKHKGEKLFSKPHISKLKHTKEFERILLTKESSDFINYVKKTFPEFNDTLFVYNLVPNQSGYTPSISEAKPTKVTDSMRTTKDILREEISTKVYPSDQEVTTKATNLNTTYSKDQKTKTTNISFSLLSSIYEKFNYLYLILPCFILLVLAVKDNPELLNEYIKEWITELNTITSASAQTYNIDISQTSKRILAGEAQDMITHSFREQHIFDNLDSWDNITYEDCPSYATTDYQNSYPDITNFYDRIEGVSEVSSRSTSYTEPKSNSIDIPVSSSLGYLEDIPSRWPISNTTYTQTNTNINAQATDLTNGYSDTVIYAVTPDTYSTIKDITKVNSKSVHAQASDWWFSMLDFNNLKYFPSLFEDLSKPRETYTIVQYTKEGASSSSAQLNNTDVSLYKHYINKAVKGSYLENAILKHIPSESISYNTTNIENTCASYTSSVTAPKASPYTDIISYNTKLTKASSRLASAAVETVTTENITPLQNSNISPLYEATQKNNTTSINYNLNRDSVSSTYSKYFFSETNTTDKVNALRTQDLDKHVDNTQVKLFVSEYTDNTKKFPESRTPEPVTPEQVCKTDHSNSLHTNIINNKQLSAYPLDKQAKTNIEPFSPYSPSIISDYSDLHVPLIKDAPVNAPLVEDDMSVDLHSLRNASYKTKDSISTNTESINFDHDLSVPDLDPNKLTSPTLTEDYNIANTESNHGSLDLSIHEAKPTKATAPLLDDDSDFNTLHIPGTLNFEETSSLLNNHQGIDMRDLSNAKSTIVNNNKHIMNIELNLDTLQDRVNSINDEFSSLLQEKAELTNKLNNNSHNVESFTERTTNNDNPLYTTYKNAYNSFMQWGINTSSPVSSNDIISKLNQINIKLNSLEETKSDLLNNININNNSLANFNNHNARLRQFILENSNIK